jgi:hypothetical protein
LFEVGGRRGRGAALEAAERLDAAIAVIGDRERLRVAARLFGAGLVEGRRVGRGKVGLRRFADKRLRGRRVGHGVRVGDRLGIGRG